MPYLLHTCADIRSPRRHAQSPDTNIDDGYYRRHITVIDERLALGGVRLAAVLNRVLTAAR